MHLAFESMSWHYILTRTENGAARRGARIF
jgi:hypothetical protein